MNILKNIIWVALVLIAATAPITAHATDTPYYIRIGAAVIDDVDKGHTYADGVAIPGASYSTNKPLVAAVTGGVFVTPKIAIEATLTSDGTTRNTPGGSLAGLPNLGSDSFVTTTFTGTWHPLRNKLFSPYVGGGVLLHFTTREKDGLVSDFKVKNGHGLVLQTGVDWNVSSKVSLNLDVKKAFYSTQAAGLLGPQHISANAKLDPVIVAIGTTWHF